MEGATGLKLMVYCNVFSCIAISSATANGTAVVNKCLGKAAKGVVVVVENGGKRLQTRCHNLRSDAPEGVKTHGRCNPALSWKPRLQRFPSHPHSLLFGDLGFGNGFHLFAR